MDAGYGAEEQATRRSRKLERLRRERDADASTRSAVEAELERIQRQQRAWSAGAEGERQVAAMLDPLAQFGWVALHDVHWPGRPQANLDHVAIGPGGVIVIDAKNWSGGVELRGGVLRQNGYSREREVDGVAQAAAAVTALLAPQHRASVRAVICLAAQDQPPEVAGSGVTVVGRLQLPAWLATMPCRLSPYDVADIGRHLHTLLAGPATPTLPPRAALEWSLGNRPGGPPPQVAVGASPTQPGRSQSRPRSGARSGPRSGARSSARAGRPANRRRSSQSSGAGAALVRFGLVLLALVIFLNVLPQLTR